MKYIFKSLENIIQHQTFFQILIIVLIIGIIIDKSKHPIIELLSNCIKLSLLLLFIFYVFQFFRYSYVGGFQSYHVGPDKVRFHDPRTNYRVYIGGSIENFTSEFIYSEFYDDLHVGKYTKWKHDNIDSVFIEYVKLIEIGNKQFKGICSIKEYSDKSYVGKINYEIELLGDFSDIRNKNEIIRVKKY
jgi:hypothetical protein